MNQSVAGEGKDQEALNADIVDAGLKDAAGLAIASGLSSIWIIGRRRRSAASASSC